jgi:hypothetical protein
MPVRRPSRSPCSNGAFLQPKTCTQQTNCCAKNTDQNGRYVAHIQSLVENGSKSYDFPLRIGSTACKRKRRHGESSVGKVASLVHVLHKHASIRAEIYLGMPAASHSVTLSRSEGLSHWAQKCFAAAQHDSTVTSAALSPSESIPLVLAPTDADGY